MALIQCPECGKEVSDAAASCPHCGYPIAPKPIDHIQPQPGATGRDVTSGAVKGVFYRETPLGELAHKNIPAGILLIIAGILCAGIALFSYLILFPFGILLTFATFVIFGGAATYLSGYQDGTCPYCKTAVKVSGSGDTFKCPKCKKISARTKTSLKKRS